MTPIHFFSGCVNLICGRVFERRVARLAAAGGSSVSEESYPEPKEPVGPMGLWPNHFSAYVKGDTLN